MNVELTDSLGAALQLLVSSPAGAVAAGVWGALWGSFLNVCIHRIGLYESVVRPRSRCPHCGRNIRALENIPILSWLWLRGRCAGCRAAISVRYPLVELLGLAVAVALWLRIVTDEAGDPVHRVAAFFVAFAFSAVMIVLAGIDVDHMLIPDRVTYPAIPIFFVAAIALRDVPVREIVSGPFVGYGIIAITAELGYFVLKREVMGYGDAKLLAVVGAAFGWRAVAFSYFAAPFVGLLVLVPLQLARKQRLRGIEVPDGPFLATAAIAYLFLDRELRFFMPF